MKIIEIKEIAENEETKQENNNNTIRCSINDLTSKHNPNCLCSKYTS